MKLVNRRLGRIILIVAVLWIVVSGFGGLAQEGEQIAANADLAVSVHLPAGYVFSTQQGSDVYSTVLIWAEDADLLERAIQTFYLGGGTPPGNFGVIVVVNPGFWSLFSAFPDDALLQVLQIATDNPSAPLTVNQQFQYNIGDLYNAYVMDATTEATNRRSYIGGFVANDEIILFSLNTSPMIDFEAQAPLLEAIGDTIRVPAEEGAVTSSSLLATPTLGQIEDLPTRAPSIPAAPTEAAPNTTTSTDDTVFLATQGNRLSIVLPSQWIIYDLAQDENIFAYGESDGAGLSRLAQARPDLVTDSEGTPEDTGGLVILYAKADFGLDADETDLTPLMEQLMQNLTAGGFEIIEQPAPLDDDESSGIYVVVRGAEHGYIALAPFGNEIAYITATSADGDFEQDRDFLMGIVQSVSVPAAQPEPEATEEPRTGGLGGLGGLQQQATPTKAGLGGLGGLGGGGEMTATATPPK